MSSDSPTPLPWTHDYVCRHLDAQLPRLHIIEELVSPARAVREPPPVLGLSPRELCLTLNRIQILDWYKRTLDATAMSPLSATDDCIAVHESAASPTKSSNCRRLINILLQPCFALSYMKRYHIGWNKDKLCFLKEWKEIRAKFGPRPGKDLSIGIRKCLYVKIDTTTANKTRDSFETIKQIFSKRVELSALLLRPSNPSGWTKLMEGELGLEASFMDVKLMVQFFTDHGTDDDGKERKETAFAQDPDHDGVTPTFFADLAQEFIERDYMWLPCCLTSSVQENSETMSPSIETPQSTPTKSPGVANRRARAIKTVQDCGLFPRPLMRGAVLEQNALNDFRLFGFCLGIALRDRRMFPVPLSVAFADALCGKRITLWDVMIGQFLADARSVSWGVPAMEYLDSGSRFGLDCDDDAVEDDECGKLIGIPDLSLLAPEDVYPPALPSLPLHALCPSSISFIATRMSTTTTGCLLHLSQPDMASFPDEETLVAISGANLPEGFNKFT